MTVVSHSVRAEASLARKHGFAWLALCLALVVHVIDEALTDFLSVYNPAVQAIRSKLPFLPLPTFSFEVWLSGLIFAILILLSLSILVFRGSKRMRPLSYVFAIIMLLNGMLHVAGSFYFGRMIPGVYSSPLLLAGSVYLWFACSRKEKKPMKVNRHLLILMLSLGVLSAFAHDQKISPTLSSLFEAERAFAKRCGEVGIRASFLEFFADDAIVFRPHPVKYKEAVKDGPAPPNPLAYALEWEPIFGGVSAAGDMGYDTGPSVFTDKTAEKPTSNYGFFFSVWKKQADGNWKVVLDVGGAQTKEPYTGSREAKTAPAMKKKATNAKVNVETERANLLNAERAFLKSAQTDGMVKAFAKHLSQDARVHRNGVQPILGQDAIAQFFAKPSFIPTWEPMFADVAQSGDLGYTYGSYELKATSNANATTEKGYYARVWKRGTNDQWQVVLDTTSPLPPEQK